MLISPQREFDPTFQWISLKNTLRQVCWWNWFSGSEQSFSKSMCFNFFIFISSCRNCYPLLLVPKFYTFKQGYFVQMKFGWKWFCRSRKHFQSCQWINFQYFANNLSFVKDMVITFNILNPLLPRKLFTTNDWICLMVLDLG